MMHKKPFFIMLGMVLACPQFLKAMDKNKLLLDAAKTGNFGDVRKSLHEGVKVGITDRYGNTPLHWAAKKGHQEIVELLIKHGSNVNSANEDGNIPLHWAAEGGSTKIVELLIENGANVRASNRGGDTPLHKAAAKGNKEVAQVLLSKGANPFVKNKRGWTPIDSAREIRKTKLRKDMVRILAFSGLEGNPECPICFEEKPKAEMVVLPCGHYICRECLEKLPNLTCPTCRRPFQRRDII